MIRDIACGFCNRSSGAVRIVKRRATVIAAGALLLLAGFAIGEFVVNFDQLQRLAEQNGGIAVPETAASSNPVALVPVATPEVVAEDPAALEPWLGPLNRYRKMVGLAPVA